MSDVETAADPLLRALLDQQAALASLQAESVRLQRLLMQRLLGTAPEEQPAAVESPPMEAEADAEASRPLEAAQSPRGSLSGRPALRVVGSRGDRYYQAAQQGSRATPGQTLERLEALRAIQDAGDTARLILAFGPHAGETLGQVAHADPDYVRRLAVEAKRPDVRAAAMTLATLLPEPRRPGRARAAHRLGSD